MTSKAEKRPSFLILDLLQGLLRTLLYPLFWGLTWVWPWARERWRLESTWPLGPSTPAWWALEVSSEGELEQFMPFLSRAHRNGARVDLFYASASVRSKVEKLAHEMPQLSVRCLPLLRYSIFPALFGRNILAESQAQALALCRYDFYPELLFWQAHRQEAPILLSASHKGRSGRGPKAALWRWAYDRFSLLVAAGAKEADTLRQLGVKGRIEVGDFRIGRILERQEMAAGSLERLACWGPYHDYLRSFPIEGRWVLGSAYPEEAQLLAGPEFVKALTCGKVHLLVAPHKLDSDSLARVHESFVKHASGVPVMTIARGDDGPKIRHQLATQRPGIIILGVPAVLCELYTYFGVAYVGGGHRRSIHSVLEPNVAGAAVACGPRTHRSTEIDLIQESSPHFVKVVEQWDQFFPWAQSFLQGDGAQRLLLHKGQRPRQAREQAGELVALLNEWPMHGPGGQGC